MASIWKGSINFGLVNVPVELRTAVRADHISFKLLHADDKSPVRYQRVNPATGEEVAWNDIVKGYEYTKGKYIVLTDDDFKAAALESSKTIDICDFVAEDEIDPRFFETPYFVVPTKGGEKAYALLREAMRETSSVGIGKIIMRQSQHLAGLHVVDDALVLELMRFATEVVDPNEYNFPPAAEVRPVERTMAVQLVKSLAASFEPAKYTDDYRANLMRIINAKAKGEEVTLDQPADESDDGKVLDLMERLRASLERGKGARAKGAAPNDAEERADGEGADDDSNANDGRERRSPKRKVAAKRTRRARTA